MNRWEIGKPDNKKVNRILGIANVGRAAAEVLAARGIENEEQLRDFFAYEQTLSDPFSLSGMKEAADMINDAIDAGDRICIYGDYDCDGVTATVMLYTYFESMGADVTYYIPERKEGYGMNKASIKKLAEDGVNLIVTVDNGISAFEETELAKQLGMRIIITDHHLPSDTLPNADVIVDPHIPGDMSPYKQLCGAGVALKLVAAMEGGNYEIATEQFGELAALATIADVVPLTGENRIIVQSGMRLMEMSDNEGINALIDVSKTEKLTSVNIAFTVTPRINAAGRCGSPKLAAELLCCDDPNEAAEIAKQIDDLNRRRQSIESDILKDIEKITAADPMLLKKRVLVFAGEGWHHGIIGIVASKVEEKFGKPTIIITKEGEYSRGSARSFGEFSIFSLFSHCAELMTRWGGHPGAGGFTVKTEDIPRLVEMIDSYARQYFPTMPKLTLKAEKILSPGDLKLEYVNDLSVLEPFGMGNPSPCFAVIGAVVKEIVPLSNGIHTRLEVNYGGVDIPFLMFKVRTENVKIKLGAVYNFIVELGINEFNGEKNVSVKVKDYRRQGVPQESILAAADAYEHFCLGEIPPKILLPRMIPERPVQEAVYKALGADERDIDTIFTELYNKDTSYCMVRLALDIFEEAGLAKIDIYNNTAKRLPVKQKADLEKTPTMKRLRKLQGR